MATDLRSVTDCAIPQPLLSPVTDFDPATAARIELSGMRAFSPHFRRRDDQAFRSELAADALGG